MGVARPVVRPAVRRSIPQVYRRLLARYGPQHWWPGESAFEVIVGAILTQQTAWTNVEKALTNLKDAGALSPERLAAVEEDRLADLIRPSGFYRTKARKLKAFASMLKERFGGDLRRMLSAPVAKLRPLLLATHGIGPETADSILLYAADRPVFVIDAYTRRIFARLGLTPDRSTYDAWQRMFDSVLPADAALFNEYHALIVRLGKDHCRATPLCEGCPLLEVCPAGQANLVTRS